MLQKSGSIAPSTNAGCVSKRPAMAACPKKFMRDRA